tara:strand:+ start:595 stop:903 length:309 start_codon:yes stop_codon:yes gene_type:complete
MKRQTYSVKFKNAQSSLSSATAAFGNLYPGWGQAQAKHLALGGVVNDTLFLSEDGLVMTVSRRMTDSCYNELRALFTDDSLYSIALNSGLFDSISYPSFVDI